MKPFHLSASNTHCLHNEVSPLVGREDGEEWVVLGDKPIGHWNRRKENG